MSPQQLTFQLISSVSKLLSKIWRERPFAKASHKPLAKFGYKSRPDPDSACKKPQFEVPHDSVRKFRLILIDIVAFSENRIRPGLHNLERYESTTKVLAFAIQ